MTNHAPSVCIKNQMMTTTAIAASHVMTANLQGLSHDR